MATAAVRIDLSDRSLDFQRIALEPGVPLLDRAQSIAKLVRVWLGRFVGEPDWGDPQTIQFYINDDEGRRIDVSPLRPACSADLAGPLRGEVQELRERLKRIRPRDRTEQKVASLLSERFEILLKQPDAAYADGALFRYRDGRGKWRLVWCWGYQRSESKIVSPAVCPKADCRRLYLVRQPAEARCPQCQTPMPVFRFPWRKVGVATVCLILLAVLGGWRYWSTLPRSVLEGQVVWKEFNLPVDGVELRLEPLKVSVLSDRQGRFHFERLPAGSWTVHAAAKGFQAWEGRQELLQSKESQLLVELIGDSVLSGRIVDFVSEQPIPEAKLHIEGTSETITVDEKGSFRRAGFRSGATRLTVSAPGYPSITHDAELFATSESDLDLQLTGQGVLLGRVLSAAQDQPLADATVLLEESGQKVQTDREGWFAFRQAPTGKQTIVVEADGYAVEREEKAIPSDREAHASFKLAGAAKVSGKISREADDSPLSGVEVAVTGTKFRTRTDNEGRFQLRGVTAGTAKIEASLPGYQTKRIDALLSTTEETSLQVKLRGSSTITGRVIDELTQQPIADVAVRLVGLPYQTRTDASGNYRLKDVPGLPAKIEALSNGYLVQPVEVRPSPEEETSAPLTLSGNSTLVIEVKERWFDRPAPDVKIRLAPTDVEWSTPETGVVEIKGLRGGVEHKFQLSSEGLTSQSAAVDAKANADNRLEVVMQGNAKLTGQIVSAIDERPVSGAKVKLVDSEHVSTSDKDGRFVLEQLREGRGIFEISAPDFATRRLIERVSSDSEPATIVLGGNASLSGEVIDAATGLPIPEAEIRLDQTVLKTKSNGDGLFQLTEAFPGAGKLEIRADGYPPLSDAVELLAERNVKHDVTLTGTATVSGAILDDVGKPVPNAIIQFGETEYQVKTGPKGEFRMPRLRGGKIELQVRAPAFANKQLLTELKGDEVKSLGSVKLVSSRKLRGQVVHALTKEPLANVRLAVANSNIQAKSDEQGKFQLAELPSKPLNMKLEANGFVTEQFVTNISGVEESVQFCLCPAPRPDEILIVLTWNSAQDLHAHLFRSRDSSVEAHIFVDRPQDDNLSVVPSDRSAKSPETFRIHPLKPGRYEYVVQLLESEESTKDLASLLSKSGATVKVYQHGKSTPDVYRIGQNKKATTWQPFALEIVNSEKVINHVYKAQHYRMSLPPQISEQSLPPSDP